MNLGLGSVQFGMDYGVSNLTGKIPEKEVEIILDLAKKNHISLIDTAFSYGESEHVIGNVLDGSKDFHIVTKTPLFKESELTGNSFSHVLESLEKSLRRLRVENIYGLLIHQADDVLKPGGEYLVSALQKAKHDGLVEKIGVSVYSPSQLRQVMHVFMPDIVQSPLNLFDQRFLYDELYSERGSKGMEFHFRSIFLQGLLLQKAEHRPSWTSDFTYHFKRFDKLIQDSGLSRLQVCMGFIKSLIDVNTIALVGVSCHDDLVQILDAINEISSISVNFRSVSSEEEKLINPSLWRTH